MYRTILVPLDGSPLAERALPLAGWLAHLAHARVILLRAVQDKIPPGVDVPPPHSDGRELLAARHYLSEMADRLAEVSVVETAAFLCDATDAILEETRLRKVDLVVMATHGRSGLDRLVRGSVAESVLMRARAPVLLVRDQDGASVPRDGTPRVLVTLDGSAFAEAIIPVAADTARQIGAQLVLLQCVPPPEHARVDQDGMLVSYIDQQAASVEAEARTYLTDVAHAIEGDGLAKPMVDVRVAALAAETIAEAAHDHAAAFVAMATHGRTGVARMLMGSVADAVIRLAPAPVLLVKPRAGEPDRLPRLVKVTAATMRDGDTSH